MKIDNQFKRELEIVLDEQFPKIYIEGEEKRLMKRGDALMLFFAANIIHSRLQQEYGKECEEKGRNVALDYIKKHRADVLLSTDLDKILESARHSSNKI